jgi:hypothetical protein
LEVIHFLVSTPLEDHPITADRIKPAMAELEELWGKANKKGAVHGIVGALRAKAIENT